MRIPILILACLSAGAARPAHAQNADVLFGGWSWRSREPGSRPAGLSGAYVAVADSVRTAQVNPAGLALIPNLEVSAGTASLWAGVARRLRRPSGASGPRPTEPGAPVPCPPGPRARPFTAALYVEQAETQAHEVDVVVGPGIGEAARLEAVTEEIGASLARGVTPWLDVGATVAWRHLRMDGRSVLADALGRSQRQVTIAGDANKARAIVGALATFGPEWSPTAVRIGVAYQHDLMGWSIERTVVDREKGVVVGEPALLDIEEPPTASLGLAWRVSDAWLLSGQLDYVWYDRVTRAVERSRPGERFALEAKFEPRVAIEMTRPSPIGGYYKVRLGARRETSGRLAYEGADPVLRQAFRGTPPAFRAAGGMSYLAEFYGKAVRLDVDLSQLVLERRSTISAAGARRLSFALTGRM